MTPAALHATLTRALRTFRIRGIRVGDERIPVRRVLIDCDELPSRDALQRRLANAGLELVGYGWTRDYGYFVWVKIEVSDDE